MKTLFLATLLALTCRTLFAEQSSPALGDQSTMPAQTSNPATATGEKPLQTTQGDFWDGDEPGIASLILHPFARKQYVRRQLHPLYDRVNELDHLTASSKQEIQNVDASSQHSIQLASQQAQEAEQHAGEAGSKAQGAQQSASKAQTELTRVEEVVGNLDAYKPMNQVEIRFRSGQTKLGEAGKRALDQMAASLKGEHGYVVEIYGFAPGRGHGVIAASRRMSDVVANYLVATCNIPSYRIYAMPMGNSSVAHEYGTAKYSKSNRVELNVLKNNLGQLDGSGRSSATN